MIFNEIYSLYYQTVSKILNKALENDINETDILKIIKENAFLESHTTIMSKLQNDWLLLDETFIPIINNSVNIPLSLLEKRWLKSISLDSRIKLFDIKFPNLDDIEPLFTKDDYKIYDQYLDGDPFEDDNYIKNFKFINKAIKENKAIEIKFLNRKNKEVTARFYPLKFEYSLKDDKIRVVAEAFKYRYYNLKRIISSDYCHQEIRHEEYEEKLEELSILINDERNTMQRAMMHFAHFEKYSEKLKDNKYILHITYNKEDETEMLIRVLSFGPLIKVIEPLKFKNLIKERLKAQKKFNI